MTSTPTSDDETLCQGDTSLKDCRVAFVGKLGGMNRRDAKRLVRERGGVVVEQLRADNANLVVIGAEQMLPDDQSELLDDELLQQVQQGKVELINETQWWERLGMADSEANSPQLYTPAMLAQLLDVSLTTIRRWHRRGLIIPVRQVHKLPYFDFQEVAAARRLANLITAADSASNIEKKLARLARHFPDLQRPLTQLSVIVEGKDILLRRGEGLVEPSGQRRIDFDRLEEAPQEEPDEPVRIPIEPSAVEDFVSEDQYRSLAVELEDEGRIAEAIEVYRSLLLGFGSNAETCFTLAELLYLQGRCCWGSGTILHGHRTRRELCRGTSQSGMRSTRLGGKARWPFQPFRGP